MDELSLCLICKDENSYLAEWLDYHILLGVDRFYIYDNGSQVPIRETLAEYIARGWVVVVDIAGKGMQLYAYDHALRTFGGNTRWMGFIDTDEFLVPKTTADLKEFLKAYDAYAAFSVSSVFFGTNHHKKRPVVGQIAAYTLCTDEMFYDNTLTKWIVRPEAVFAPNSPHDFTLLGSNKCVNEKEMIVDFQRFPHSSEKIQLNHYACRSEEEVLQKLERGRGDDGNAWVLRRFKTINELAICKDVAILTVLARIFEAHGIASDHLVQSPQEANLLEKMARLAAMRQPTALSGDWPQVAEKSPTVERVMELKRQTGVAAEKKDYLEMSRLFLKRLEDAPENILLYTELSASLLRAKNPEAAWQALAQAWRIAPNSYRVLLGMNFYFLQISDFERAKNTSHLILDFAPHDVTALGFLTEALIELGQFEEALKIGVPLIELDALTGEMLPGLNMVIIEQMSNYLIEKKNDYKQAARLWELSLTWQEKDVFAHLSLANALTYLGDFKRAREEVRKARELNPKHPQIPIVRERIEQAQKAARK